MKNNLRHCSDVVHCSTLPVTFIIAVVEPTTHSLRSAGCDQSADKISTAHSVSPAIPGIPIVPMLTSSSVELTRIASASWRTSTFRVQLVAVGENIDKLSALTEWVVRRTLGNDAKDCAALSDSAVVMKRFSATAFQIWSSRDVVRWACFKCKRADILHPNPTQRRIVGCREWRLDKPQL
jgi:hypothetical protein